MYNILFIYLFIGRHLGCAYLLAIMNDLILITVVMFTALIFLTLSLDVYYYLPLLISGKNWISSSNILHIMHIYMFRFPHYVTHWTFHKSPFKSIKKENIQRRYLSIIYFHTFFIIWSLHIMYFVNIHSPFFNT